MWEGEIIVWVMRGKGLRMNGWDVGGKVNKWD